MCINNTLFVPIQNKTEVDTQTHTPSIFMLIAFKNDHDESQQNMCKKVKRALNYTPLNTIYGCRKKLSSSSSSSSFWCFVHPPAILYKIKYTFERTCAREWTYRAVKEKWTNYKKNCRLHNTHTLHSPSDIIKLKSIQASFFSGDKPC